MTELFKTIRLAVYVCALPLIATAVLSAHTLIGFDESILVNQFDEVDSYEVMASVYGDKVEDVTAEVSHILKIDDAGGVSGRIFARGETGNFGAVGMNVSLNLEGEKLAEATTASDGQFRFEGVAPGAYTFIATSPGSITTFGVYVQADEAMPEANAIQLTVAASTSNTPEIRNLLNSDIKSASYAQTPDVSNLPVVSAVSRIQQSADGSISGRVVPLQRPADPSAMNLSGNDVYLYNESGLVSKTAVDAQGFYSIEGLEAGVYDFVSFGPHGAAAMSIEVTAYDSVASSERPSPFAFASARVAVQDEFGVVLGEPTSGGNPPTVEVQVIMPPQPPTGFDSGFPVGGGFGGGGGGGFGGGFGDLGGIVGAALGVWLISEAIDDDDDGVVRQPVVVPPVIVPPAVSPF